MEIWRDIEGYEGLYQVSNEGRVKALERTWIAGRWTPRHKNEEIMSISKNYDGYGIVTLCKNGVRITKRVHRLVAEAFIPNPNNLPSVNHKDEDKTNNHVENLEWCTVEYNNNYGDRIKKMVESNSYRKPVLQLTLEGGFVKEFNSSAEAARELNCSFGEIARCCKGGRFDKSRNKWVNRNTYKGYKWSYKPM